MARLGLSTAKCIGFLFHNRQRKRGMVMKDSTKDKIEGTARKVTRPYPADHRRRRLTTRSGHARIVLCGGRAFSAMDDCNSRLDEHRDRLSARGGARA